jgi:peptidoglycan/xylan/chitin deacetylase (PgdA/CDA1 family)
VTDTSPIAPESARGPAETLRHLLKALVPASLARYRGPATAGRVALTFDDGPCPGVTDRLLDILAGRGHRGTFFVVGRRAEAQPGLVAGIEAAGGEVGNHSYSHRCLSGARVEEIAAEVERADAVIRAAGAQPRHFRPPGGRLTPALLYYLHRARRPPPVLWSACVPAEDRQPPAGIAAAVRSAALPPGAIVLLHDDREPLIEALPMILDGLEAAGLRSVTVSDLLAR